MLALTTSTVQRQTFVELATLNTWKKVLAPFVGRVVGRVRVADVTTDQRTLVLALLQNLHTQSSHEELSMVEETLVSLKSRSTVATLMDVLANTETHKVVLNVACMALIRMADTHVIEAVRTFNLHATTERQRWIGDFLAHQLGIKNCA
jgi:hypothetical protein